ncbi:MAG: ATP-binding protein [Chloroflexales bacterium]|nr:ATP-binding protein [Chloroflexales bacterium]
MSDGERTLLIVADPAGLAALRTFLEAAVSELGAAPAVVVDLLVAVNEAATNIMVHGYCGRPGPIEARVRRSGAALEVRLRDRAPLFDPTTVPPPRADLHPVLRPPGGMGVQMARHFTDELRYRVTPDGENELTLVKAGPPIVA